MLRFHVYNNKLWSLHTKWHQRKHNYNKKLGEKNHNLKEPNTIQQISGISVLVKTDMKLDNW